MEDGAGRPMTAAGDIDVLAGGGELGALMRAHDWSATPLGPPEHWPRSLRTAVRIMLTSRQPMWIGWGEKLTYLYNDAYKSIIGGKHPWALGRPTAEVWSEIWPDIQPMLATALAGDEGTYSEEQLLIMERNGYPEETYYTFSYSPIPDDNGLPGGIICANADDTQRVIGERQLALLRELATAAAEARSGHEACARSARALGSDLRDLPFALIYMAEEAGNAFVLAGASGIGSEHPAAPARIVAGESAPWPLEKALSGGDAMLMEGLGDRFGKPLPGGAWSIAPDKAALVPIVATGWQGVLVVGLSPVRLFDAGYRGFLSLAAGQIASAVSHAEAYEQERRRAEALAEIDRAKTVFFSNVSHEFRTPLTLMLGPLDELHDKLEEKGAAADAELAEVAHRNGLRLLRLVNSLLDFSRLEAGRIRARYRPVDLAAYTAELASNFRAACDRAGLELIVDCPSLARPAYVDCDMWEKIVLNLVSNAFKYTLDGRIEVKVRTHRDTLELTVRDTGVGIAEEELPRLFDRFHRIEGQRGRTQEGSGIGLALVQELVGLHGGSIDAESREGEGTCFRITLPLGKEHLPPDHIELEGEAARPGQAAAFVEEAMRWLPGDVISGAPSLFPPEGGGARVLVADDNADMRDYVVRLVAELGHEVEAVSDGQAALEAARRETPDLILTDVMMPRLDGFGLVAAVRGDPRLRDTPIIMLSARAGEEARVEGIRSGADDYLTKPFSARELAARVSGNLAIAGLRRQTAAEIRESELRLRRLFDQAPSFLAILRGPGHVFEFTNAACRKLFGDRDYIGNPVSAVLPEASAQGFIALLDRVYATGERFIGTEVKVHLEANHDRPAQDLILDFIYEPVLDAEGNVTGIFVEGQDVSARHRAETELRDQSRILETLNRTGAELAAELDLERLVQKVTDAGRELIGAEFGAFFYNVTNTDGESFRLYTLSGAKRSDFDKFPQPRNTGVFGPTFRGEGPVRSDDITRDARYGHNPPYNGMPKGHLPVRSYLAVPVISREGEVIGGLFYGHAEPGRFKERDERLLIGIAGQTSIALDNARLYQAAQREIVERQRAEALREVQNRVLELAIRDKSLEETLDALVRTIESHSTTGMLGSVLLADQEGGRLRHGAAPSLPDAYNRAIDGIAIGPDIGSCGSAAHSGKPVYVADIATDPRWADFRDLALSHGLQACWSTPILSGQGEVLGTFALYYSEPRHPPSDDLEMVDFVTRSVALVIERKRSEEALRESEAHFAALVGQTSAGLAETDLQGRFTNVNDRYCAIVGRSRDELIGRPLQEITHPDDIARNMALFERMVRDGEQYEIEKRYVRPDGSIVWVNNNVNLIRPTQGKQASVLAVCIDTTERKASEEARERFVALIETSQDFIGFATPDGIPQYMNPAGERLVGLTVAEARDRGITIRDYFFPADRERLEEHILPIVLRKGSWAGEFTLRNFRTGAAIPMWFDVFVVRDGRTGKTLNICTVSRDLTAQKRSEA
ncbi:MAG TPA: GAF domain-containing protein, partial [Sphingomonas sp.]|nr:GAF domain-containing protein [Sphingomonas sp.]